MTFLETANQLLWFINGVLYFGVGVLLLYILFFIQAFIKYKYKRKEKKKNLD
jgi:hypothetical protein